MEDTRKQASVHQDDNKTIDRNIVAKADRVMKTLLKGTQDKRKKLTSSQLRKFLVAINTITNKINAYKMQPAYDGTLSESLAEDVQFLKVKIAYQAGRDTAVKIFVRESELFGYIDNVGNSIENYELLAKYMEALVAYHKYHGGWD